MQLPEPLKAYAKQLGFPNSERLGKLLLDLFDTDQKLKIAGELPGTIVEIADKTGLDQETTRLAILELQSRGAVNERMLEPGRYRLFPAIIEIRDAAALTPGISSENVRLWDDLIRKEFHTLVPLLEKLQLPPLMRVIPIEETVASEGAVLDIDSAREIIKGADQVVAIPCVCRQTGREVGRGEDCTAPDDVNLCLMVNGFGFEAVQRGIGEIISREEALRRLALAEEAGLVHLTRNNVKKDMMICNCCACCCTGLFMLNEIGYSSFAPSRFRVVLNEDDCTACGTCVDRCQFNAMTVDDVARIDLEKCFGCGVCVTTCPGDALSLQEFRSREHIRVT